MLLKEAKLLLSLVQLHRIQNLKLRYMYLVKMKVEDIHHL
jgi:hypothetical protein